MITLLTVRNLKRLRFAEIPLSDTVVLAGPNNFGKTTALQALSIWHLASQRWLEARGSSKSKARERKGVPMTRKDFTAVPVRTLDLLWTQRVVGRRKGETRPPVIEITVEGMEQGTPWRWGMELQYANPELLYCRPGEDVPMPQAAQELTVVHMPPLGGIRTEEERRERGIQDLLIGEGRPGEIIRNLLLQIYQTSERDWRELAGEVEKIFQVELLEPIFTKTYIMCEYLPRPRGMGGRAPRPLDISNAGSGFHQVLLLLAFFYARPGSVLLLDEPDAHLHIILQRDVYALLRRKALEKKAQLLISTHSEVILDETDPGRIVAFTGEHPHLLVNSSQKSQLKRALKELRSLDFLLADQVGSVLYVEGETDASLLREWARVLGHPAAAFLEKPFIHPLGSNHAGAAREHFFALREACPVLKGVCLTDRSVGPPPADSPPLRYVQWARREIENYLLVPGLLRRFVAGHSPAGPQAQERVDARFARQVPAGFDPFDDTVVFLRDVKASEDFLLSLLGECGLSTSKKDLYLIAAQMRPEEIHPEVRRVLDVIATLNPPTAPAEQPVGQPLVAESSAGEEEGTEEEE